MTTEEQKKALELISQKAKAYKKTMSGLKVPEELISALENAWNENGKKIISIPVKPVNEMIGFNGDLSRERASQIKAKLNNQYEERLEAKQQYHMGYSTQEERYLFDIVEVKEDKEEKEE